MAETSVSEERSASEPHKNLSEDAIIKTLLSSSSVALRDLIPSGPIKSKNAVQVARWILTCNSKQKSENNTLQRIKWLTAVMEYGIVDSLIDLQKLFTPLIQLIYISKFQAHICHLLFMLATPHLHKFQVERIAKNAKVNGLNKPLAGLLSRLKSLRPDLVPQAIPHQSSVISFPKAPAPMRNGLYTLSEQMRERNELPNQTSIVKNAKGERITKKMRLDIVPSVQHIYLKSSFEVDFSKRVLLTQFQTFEELAEKITTVEMPNHVGSLLSKREYHYVLALNLTPHVEALLSRWLYVTLYHEFIERSQLDGKEGKRLLLDRVIEFQHSTGCKLMAVYEFLSEYLRTWDGVQYSSQIFELLSQIPFLPYSDLYDNFLKVLEELHQSWNSSCRLKILNTCQKLIFNLMLQKFGPSDEAKELFQNAAKHSEEGNVAVLVEGVYVVSEVIRFTERLLNTALTSSSDISLVVHSLQFYSWLIDVEVEYQLPFRTFCQPITVYMALFSPAPLTISLLCQLLCKYRELGRKELMGISSIPGMEEFLEDSLLNAEILSGYNKDVSNCLIYEKAFVPDGNSVLSKTPKRVLRKLNRLSLYRSALGLVQHPAFTGVARLWLKSKVGDSHSSDIKYNVFEEIDADKRAYLKYLFDCFPAIRDYINQFQDSAPPKTA